MKRGSQAGKSKSNHTHRHKSQMNLMIFTEQRRKETGGQTLCGGPDGFKHLGKGIVELKKMKQNIRKKLDLIRCKGLEKSVIKEGEEEEMCPSLRAFPFSFSFSFSTHMYDLISS
jgi:hypothetical protein